ncbi:MAG: hypothetical protein R3F56_17285 [Planctomycetota bacterium]
MNHLNLLGMTALFALSAAAQNVTVFPSDHASRDGYSSQSYFPFSYGICRQQALYHRRDLAIPNGSSITGAGVRHDAGSSSTGYRIQLEVLANQTSIDPRPGLPTSMSSTFASNYQGTPTTVFTRKIVDLPNLTATSARPSPTNVTVTFDTPFRYDATKNLLTEWVVYANANSNQAFTYGMDYAYVFSATEEFGVSCPTSGNATPRCYFGSTAIGGPCTVNLNNSAGSSPATLFLGAVAQAAPIPLQSVGMPGCYLHIDPTTSVSTATNAGGNVSISFPVPNALNLIRRSVVAQYVTADLFANTAGLVSSNGARVTLGVEPMMSILSSPGSTTATVGSLASNYGAVSVFTWQ